MTLCTACGEENPQGARFCMSCGAALERACPSCGTPVPDGARFCMSCGTQLGDAAAAAAPAPSPPADPSPPGSESARSVDEELGLDERRTATVLFADLSGYTAIAETLDPETVKRLLARILARLGEEVERFGGHVDKYIGDNVMAVFGAPVAHGDDPQRAVLAGLGMQAAMIEANEPLQAQHGVTFELRVGINTGEVMAGNVGEGYTVIGDSVNVAARLQAAARPGTVTVGEDTYLATRAQIEYAELPERLTLKGKAEPVGAWEAVGERADAAEPASGSARRRAPLLGRAGELARLNESLERVVQNGSPHLVTVLGEAGVGKSRLVEEFELAVGAAETPAVVHHGRCLPYGTGIAYWPLGEVVRTDCGIAEDDTPEVAWEKLSSRLGAVLALAGEHDERTLASSVALIARLLGIDAPDDQDEPADAEDALRGRERAFSAVRATFEGLASQAPQILIWEDIHWADEGMLDLIEHLGRWLRSPVLQLCLARDELLERREGWGGVRRDATTVFLDPLAENEARELVAALLGEGEVAGHLVATVAARAGGNPLFAEEMVRHVSDASASAADLPATVQGLLAARLDSLEPVQRRILGHAAVIGRAFAEDVLAAVAQAEPAQVRDVLTVLRERDLLVGGAGRVGAGGEPELLFKHALIRDAAYEMLPKAVRATDHFRIARYIEDRAGQRVDEVAALLAEHYERAAQLADQLNLAHQEMEPYRERALHFLELAGDGASALYSNADAYAHYESAAQRAGDDADALARIIEKQGDVALRLGRVDAAIAVWERALEHQTACENTERVAELHRKIGAGLAHKGERKQAIEHHQQGINLIKDGEPSLALVRLYEEAAWLYMQIGDNMLAIYASEKALRLAERLGEVRAASRAHGIFGRVFGRIGDAEKAHENLERAVALARESDAHETVIALIALGTHLETFDAKDEAAGGAYREALALAQQIGDVPAEIELHAAVGRLALHAGDWDEVGRCAATSAELAEREGLVGKLCLPYALQGWLSWRDGNWLESERAYTRARELSEQIGWSEVCFDALYGLATTLDDRGDWRGAESALADALGLCERAGLIVQSIQATAARARLYAGAGRDESAREAADGAVALAERVHYPVGEAAATEASGAVAAAGDGCDALLRARQAWRELGRPLEAARCELLLGRNQLASDPEAARGTLHTAADAYEALGVRHLAARARELAAGAVAPL